MVDEKLDLVWLVSVKADLFSMPVYGIVHWVFLTLCVCVCVCVISFLEKMV